MIAELSAIWRALCLALGGFLLASCSGADVQRGPVVLAASSLQGALEDVAAAWSAEGYPLPVLSFASTSALARQIAQGAPADVFVSADQDWMDTVAAADLLREGTQRDVVGNRLVLIRGRGGSARAVADLGDGKLALADPVSVPAGRYAKAALESSGQWREVADNLVPAENVRAALALVERGEATLGIVYATDALASAKVEVVEELPAAAHPPIRYPAAVLATSRHPDAEGFLDFLSSPAGSRIFEQHGFRTYE